jgi:protein disulfide-isomerase A1
MMLAKLYFLLVLLVGLPLEGLCKKNRGSHLPKPPPPEEHHAEPSHSLVVPIWNASLLDEFVEHHAFVAAFFYAPWCGHCRQVAPHWTEASVSVQLEWPDVKLIKVDMTRDGNIELRARYAIRGFPSLKLFKAHSPLPYEYRGPRDAAGITRYLSKEREKCKDCVTRAGVDEDLEGEIPIS